MFRALSSIWNHLGCALTQSLNCPWVIPCAWASFTKLAVLVLRLVAEVVRAALRDDQAREVGVNEVARLGPRGRGDDCRHRGHAQGGPFELSPAGFLTVRGPDRQREAQ